MYRRTEEEVGPTVGLPRQRHSVGFLNVPAQAPTPDQPLVLTFQETAPFQSLFTTRMAIRRTFTRLVSQGHPEGTMLVQNNIQKVRNQNTH